MNPFTKIRYLCCRFSRIFSRYKIRSSICPSFLLHFLSPKIQVPRSALLLFVIPSPSFSNELFSFLSLLRNSPPIISEFLQIVQSDLCVFTSPPSRTNFSKSQSQFSLFSRFFLTLPYFQIARFKNGSFLPSLSSPNLRVTPSLLPNFFTVSEFFQDTISQ